MAEKSIEVKIKGARLSFAQNLFVPKPYKNKQTGEIESYSIETAALLDRVTDKDQIKMLLEAQKQAISNEWPSDPPLIPADRRCVREGEEIDPDTGQKIARYEGYAGQFVINAKRKIKLEDVDDNGKLRIPNPVQLLGPRKTAKKADGTPCFPRLTQADGLLYSGCYADLIVRIYAYNGSKDGNPHRVNASLEAVKFVRHGEAFGAKQIDADAAFDEEDEDDGFEDGGNAGSKEVDDFDLG